MPRDPSSKIYSPPEGTYGVPDEDILSASHNAWLDDMAFDLSAALPIAMGGTGANSVELALENLGGASLFYLSTLMSGSIWYFAHMAIPDTFLSCDGRAVSRTQYRALFQRIGTSFGAGNGSTTFNLPDLRAEFIRGWDGGRGIDPDRILGSSQAQQNKQHTHTGSANSTGNHNHTIPNQHIFSGGTGVQAGSNLRHNENAAVLPIGSAGNHSHTITLISAGAENRPKNVALIPAIKT